MRINPTKLDWRRFTIAVNGPVLPASERQDVSPRRALSPNGAQVSEGEDSGQMIACAQLKPVPRGLTELASLAVYPKYRHQGIARALIEHLLADAPRPVYLTCRSNLGELYEKFGFRILSENEMPPYYRRLQRFAGLMMELTRRNETLLVMKLG